MRARNFDASAAVLNGAIQIVFLDPPYDVRQFRKSKNSAQDSLLLIDVKNTFQLAAGLLGLGEHAVLLCTAQQSTV